MIPTFLQRALVIIPPLQAISKIPLGNMIGTSFTSTILSRADSIPQASSVLVALRGGGGAAAVLSDYSSAAGDYFGGVRTPASLVVSASIGALFTGVTKPTELAKRNRIERLSIRLYNVSMMVSFMLSLCAIVTETAAGVVVLHENFDPMAKSAYDLLNREFAFEFLTVRLSYLLSLLTFVVGVTCRALLEFELLKKGNQDTALALSFSMGAMVMYLWSYINRTLYDSQTLGSMALTAVSIVVRRILNERTPLQFAAITSLALSVVFCGRAVRKTTKLEENTKD